MIKAALTDPRVNPDPDQMLRVASGNSRDNADLASGFAAIAPLYAVPDHLKGQAETDVGAVLATAIKPFYETSNAAMNDCVSRYDVRDHLQDIQVPALIYVGRYDWITPVVFSEELAAKIPNARLVIFEKSGHLAALEEKTAFRAEVMKFVETLGI